MVNIIQDIEFRCNSVHLKRKKKIVIKAIMEAIMGEAEIEIALAIMSSFI